jgi:hypothetical protein
MTDFTAQTYTITPTNSDVESPSTTEVLGLGITLSETTIGVPAIVTYYLMRWLDIDCGTTPPTYRNWVVTNTVDPTGIHYSGSKCGATAISGAVVAATWEI